MLTYAVDFVLDVELICFALVLGAMALQDRDNRGLRWLALAYLSGLCGAVLDYSAAHIPAWMSLGLALEAAPVGYACMHASIAELVGWGRRTRWVGAAMLAAALPVLLAWSDVAHLSASATLQDGVLAAQTALSVGLLLATRDEVTRWPRLAMAGFLAAYSAVEWARVGVFLRTGRMPGQVAPGLEMASGLVYVVSCAALPLAFIWMMNARLHADLLRQAVTDPLTGLLNRRGLRVACERALRPPSPELALVLLDLDHFKQINDTLGHPAGDDALEQVGGFLLGETRPSETLGRLGGEEFLLLLPGHGAEAARQRAEELRSALAERRLRLEGEERAVTASLGVAAGAGGEGATWTTLLRNADAALYAAKRAGRNRTRVFERTVAAGDRA